METEGVVVVLGENKDIEAPLDREEESRLADLEEQIETAINAIGKRFYQIGMALVSINEQRLYRAYGTFDRYCETKWHFTRQRVYQLMNSAKEMDKLYQAQTPSGNSSHFVFGEEVLFDAIDGKNVKNFLHQMKESHLHELKGLSVEAKFEVYDEACRTSPPGQLRARHVKEIRAALYPEPIPDWGKNEKGKIKRKQLLEALDAVLPGVATSDKQMTGPNAFSYLDSFVFDDKWLKSYNGKICVSYPLDTGLVGAVAAKEFYSVIKAIDSDDLEYSTVFPTLTVKSGRTNLSMEFPSDIGVYAKNTMAAIQASLEHLKWKQLPKDFFKALSLCVPTMATDPNFGSLTLLDIEPDGKMITCDDYQISIYQLSTPMDPFALTRSVVLKIKPLSKFSEYALDEEKRWLHFRQSNGTVFSVITSVVKFSTQKILSLLEGEVSGPYRFPEGTVKALRRAGIFGETSSEDEYRYVGICAEGDVLHITGTHPHGSVDEVVPMNGAVLPNLRIKIRPEHLEKILGLTSTFTVVGTSMFVFEQENYKYTIGFRTSEDN